MESQNKEANKGEFEPQARIVLVPPIHEVLSDAKAAENVFDLSEDRNEILIDQVREHQELAEFTHDFINKLSSPGVSLQELMRHGDISANDLAELYVRLSKFMSEPENARVALYLPFEWLPDASFETDDDVLQAATDEFRDTFVRTWWSLLREHDIRAHYNDGDMKLDIDANPDNLPLVIKAAHLLPFILAKGIVTEAEVDYIYNGTNSFVLRQSIDEAMRVYHHRHDKAEAKPINADASPEAIYKYYADQLELIHGEREADASPQRLGWLEKVAYETTVYDMARHLAEDDDVVVRTKDYLMSSEDMLQSIGCVTLGRIAEQTGSLAVRDWAANTLVNYGDIRMKYFSLTARRLYHGGILSEYDLERRGVTLPRLSGELSKNIDLDSDEMEVVGRYIDALQNRPELTEDLYPVVLVGGSRLKGYGDEHSDIDVTILVRPGTDESRRKDLVAAATELLGDKPHEFWLHYDDGRLVVRDIETDDHFVGNDYWVHVLFGGAWVGDSDAIGSIQSQLYPPYFEDKYFGESDMSLQRAYRRRIEDDALLYRLLHRGYAHHYPAYDRLDMPYSELIDGQSVFYDSGYRQLATQLFIEKVFLPTLNKPN